MVFMLAIGEVALTPVTRVCSSPACTQLAEFTMTSDYDERVAVIGPLAPEDAREGYDLCRHHAVSFTAPRGWEIIRFDETATQ